jgi:hypothetical protein
MGPYAKENRARYANSAPLRACSGGPSTRLRCHDLFNLVGIAGLGPGVIYLIDDRAPSEHTFPGSRSGEVVMSTLANRLSGLSEADGFHAEGAQLVRKAEEQLRQIIQNSSACEGERLAALEIVEAMKRVQLLIEAHRDGGRMRTVLPPAVRLAPEKRRWWPLMA